MNNKIIFYFALFFILSIYCKKSQAQINVGRLDSFFNAVSANNQVMGSVTIAKNGKILYNRVMGYSNLEKTKPELSNFNTLYRIGSITKTFTAVIIFQLIEEKKLTLGTKLSKFFPAIPNADQITIEHLLRHTSGIPDHVNENLDWIKQPHTRAELLEKIALVKPHFEPGTKQQYSNGGFLLLGYIIQEITGKTYQAAVDQRIVKKINLKHTISGSVNNINTQEARPYIFDGIWSPVTDIYFPNIIAVGDILSTPTDLVILINALLSGKLISKDSYQQMTSFGKDMFGMGLEKAFYYKKVLVGHNGGTFGNYSACYAVPEDGVSFAVTTNGMNYNLNNIVLAILKIYYNDVLEIPFQAKTEDLDELVGQYSSDTMPLKITISKSGSVLVAQASGQPRFSLDALNRDSFRREQYDVLLKFNRAKQEMILVQGGKSYNYIKDQQE
jgi:D-alanyl-D-alanine carboxypeptidase